MALLRYTLDGDLTKNWQSVLQSVGMEVIFDEKEFQKNQPCVPCPGNLDVAPYRIQYKTAELRVIEVSHSDKPEGKPYITFMPTRTKGDRELLSMVQNALLAAGATIAARKKQAR